MVRPPFKKNFIPRHPFDMILTEHSFPKVAPLPDDTDLTNVSVR